MSTEPPRGPCRAARRGNPVPNGWQQSPPGLPTHLIEYYEHKYTITGGRFLIIIGGRLAGAGMWPARRVFNKAGRLHNKELIIISHQRLLYVRSAYWYAHR